MRNPLAVDVRAPRFGRIDLVVFATLLLLGLIHLPFPFEADQAVRMRGAEQMNHGALLYRDYWDIMGPAIYAFNWAGGKLFGFHEAGVHTFELLVLLGFALLLRVWLARYDSDSWTVRLAPLFVVGHFYAVTGHWHLSQVEGLIGVPLFLTLGWLIRAHESEGGRGRWMFLAGLMGGVTVLFKPFYVVFALAFWTWAALAMARNGRTNRVGMLLGTGVPFLLGLALPVAGVIGFYAGLGMLGTLTWTFVTVPARIVAEIRGLRFSPLVDGLTWFSTRYGPLAALAAIGAGVSLRRFQPDPLRAGLILWVAVAAAVIAVQRASWWEYHYLLFGVPLGILAARGVTVLAAALDARMPSSFGRLAGRVAIGLLFSVPLVLTMMKASLLVHHRLGLDEEDRRQFQRAVSPGYITVLDETAFLKEPGARAGDIFVVGGEPYYWLSGRGQAGHPKGAWFFRTLHASDWSKLAADLERTPPAYVFVQMDHYDLAVRRTSANADFSDLLSRAYQPTRSSHSGTWYERRSEASAVSPGR